MIRPLLEHRAGRTSPRARRDRVTATLLVAELHEQTSPECAASSHAAVAPHQNIENNPMQSSRQSPAGMRFAQILDMSGKSAALLHHRTIRQTPVARGSSGTRPLHTVPLQCHPRQRADKRLRPPTARSDIVAFILPSIPNLGRRSHSGRSNVVYSTLRYFPPPKSRIKHPRACGSSARRSLADASVSHCRTVVRPLQRMRLERDADDNRTALITPSNARFTDLGMLVSRLTFIQQRSYDRRCRTSHSCQERTKLPHGARDGTSANGQSASSRSQAIH
jgi:hypothetical protein